MLVNDQIVVRVIKFFLVNSVLEVKLKRLEKCWEDKLAHCLDKSLTDADSGTTKVR